MTKTYISANEHILTITRSFEAPLRLVWRAWTEAALLDQWWAPKPWKSQTSYMNFQEGDYRLYAMVGPEGEVHWGRTDYQSIVVHEMFTGEDSFCDQDGNVNEAFPTAAFVNRFSVRDDTTQVQMVTEYASKEHLDQVVAMGMREGLTAAFENLDSLLTNETEQ